MATESEHKQQAEHNRRFLDAIDSSQFPDWIATASFYLAVHLVEAMFARLGLSSRSGTHTKRNNLLKTQYPDIWRAYRPLYCFSRIARYRCLKVAAGDLAYLRRYLQRTENAVGRVS